MNAPTEGAVPEPVAGVLPGNRSWVPLSGVQTVAAELCDEDDVLVVMEHTGAADGNPLTVALAAQALGAVLAHDGLGYVGFDLDGDRLAHGARLMGVTLVGSSRSARASSTVGVGLARSRA